MREVPLSNCEREFILEAIAQKKRLDGRGAYDYRRQCITFGIDRGCCQVELGNTRVLAQVSCELTEPKTTRPTDGFVQVNVELSPMAAPNFEPGRLSDYGVEINRLLERCIRESRCVDTESLCVMAGIKVWKIRVDVHALNQDGNLIDCCSIAAISALAHFRRPDVTVSGEEITIHTSDERDPVPLSIHHMPVCVTFGFYDQGKYLLIDPQEKEERVMDGKMVIGMNKHREICTFQMTGSMLLLRDQVLRCSNIAVVKVTELTELIQKALENDTLARSCGEKFGFASSMPTNKITTHATDPEEIDMSEVEEEVNEIMQASAQDLEELKREEVDMESEVKVLGPGTAQIGEGGQSVWGLDDDDDDIEEIEEIPAPSKKKVKEKVAVAKASNEQEVIELSADSEEEETVMLDQGEFQRKKPAEKIQKSGQIDLSMALKKGPKKTKKKDKKK